MCWQTSCMTHFSLGLWWLGFDWEVLNTPLSKGRTRFNQVWVHLKSGTLPKGSLRQQETRGAGAVVSLCEAPTADGADWFIWTKC